MCGAPVKRGWQGAWEQAEAGEGRVWRTRATKEHMDLVRGWQVRHVLQSSVAVQALDMFWPAHARCGCMELRAAWLRLTFDTGLFMG